MASLKAIRRRISSVKSTQQITRAMKLVAAARLRRAQEALQNAGPYHEALVRIADSLFATERAASAPAARGRRAGAKNKDGGGGRRGGGGRVRGKGGPPGFPPSGAKRSTIC